MKKKRNLILSVFIGLNAFAWAQPAQRTFLPPTMGWSSWNTFALNISDKIIEDQADAMVKTGLKAAGYEYINIDDGFWEGRGKDGQLIINRKRFPNGMRAVADYIHKLGLKAGMYSDAGDNACGSQDGTRAYGVGIGLAGYEAQDIKTYLQDWDYDFIKVDYCGGIHMGLDEREQYTKISNEIRKIEKETGRRLVFNICRWAYPGTWVSDIADSWRTTGDIYDAWASVKSIVKENLYLQAYTGGGHYNDMDMLEIGRSLNENEERTHMAYWCIASSPMLIGCDMTKLRESSLALLKNKDLIAMNQDVLGIGAPVVQCEGDVYVVAKDMEQLHGSKRAVVVMNLTDSEQKISVDLAKLELSDKILVHDCFTGKDQKLKAAKKGEKQLFEVTIPAHGSQAYFMTGKRIAKKRYEAEESWMHNYQELRNLKTANYAQSTEASGGAYAEFVGGNMQNYIEWRNVWADRDGTYTMTIAYASTENRSADITVNGVTKNNVAMPKGTAWNKEFRTIDVPVTLKRGFNTIAIGQDYRFAPNIDYMELHD
jgi:hypothetical protein